MTKERDNPPRLSVEITDEQFFALQRLIPHGTKRILFDIIINDLIKLLESTSKREAVYAAIIKGMVDIPSRSLLNDGAKNELC